MGLKMEFLEGIREIVTEKKKQEENRKDLVFPVSSFLIETAIIKWEVFNVLLSNGWHIVSPIGI